VGSWGIEKRVYETVRRKGGRGGDYGHNIKSVLSLYRLTVRKVLLVLDYSSVVAELNAISFTYPLRR
jgi:hypothetical protein